MEDNKILSYFTANKKVVRDNNWMPRITKTKTKTKRRLLGLSHFHPKIVIQVEKWPGPVVLFRFWCKQEA